MTSKRQAGFTLIELIIFIVVVSAGLAGILSVMDTVVKSSADPMVHKQAMALADSILEEILQKEFADPDGGANVVESGRDTYDDVDDYNGINETIKAAGPIFLNMPTELYDYIIGINVVGDTTTLGTTPNNIPAKRVTVTITHGTEVITMTGYRSNY